MNQLCTGCRYTPRFTASFVQSRASLESGPSSAKRISGIWTGPVQMPLLQFVGDDARSTMAQTWTNEAVKRGVYLHPVHNWFLSAAHTPDDIDLALERTDDAFAELARLTRSA